PLLAFCSIHVPPSPLPTLFPYTTLFRSSCATDPPRTGRPTRTDPPPGDVRGPSGIVEGRPETSGTRRTALSGERGNAIGAVEEVDRKSTRLNSSHVKISYAVFCLKKKIT